MIRFVSAVAAERGALPGVDVGVGPLRAAVATARLLSQERPSAVIFLGTAGQLPGGPAVGSVIRAGRLGLGEAAAALGRGYVPMPLPVLQATAGPAPTEVHGEASVLTNAAITTDPALIEAYAGWEVEHMETYGVALACAEAGVPFGAILGITNIVGPDAHAQWRANRDLLQVRVQAVARTLIRG